MLNPILASSALRRMRSARTIVICGVYIAVLFFLTCLCMSVFLVSDTVTLSDISRGMNTYLILLLAQFALIVLVAPAMTASSIASERERQTLELLLVTNTGSMRIVFGKLMESFAFLALLIVSSLPVMCLTMLLGGVTLFHILSGLLFLLCCAFAAASVGILCSSFMKNTVGATIISYIILLAIGAGTLLPLVDGIDKAKITDVLYNSAAYAAMTPFDALKMIPKTLLINPGVGLVSLIESQTGMIQSDFASMRGRLNAMFLLLEKIGYEVVPFLNMAIMIIAALILVCIASALVRPRRVRVRRKA